MSGSRQVPFLPPVSYPAILIDSQPSLLSPHTYSGASSSVLSLSCPLNILTFDVDPYQKVKYDRFIASLVAVEEGRPASSERLRTAEPRGRELAWIKALFVVQVLILAIVAVNQIFWIVTTCCDLITTEKDGSGDLTREAISKSVDGSLQRLRRPEGVNVLYIHRADPATPLEEQIQGFAEQIAQDQVLEKVLHLCEQNRWPKPSYYQGTYNVISRAMETKLWPILQTHNIRFVAYWAAAAGFLTGNFVNGQHAGTRMGDDNPLGKQLQRMYGSEDVLSAVKKFDAETRVLSLTPLEVAIRWIFHHSKLGDDDCVLLGASKVEQIVENVAFVRKGRLADHVLPLVEELWDGVKRSRGEII
ncbi:NADP-dependent oxidoreductase domain-containing protein [Xylaria sp. FL0064]|nr:NADP-dependent oxidoreductase domain-containing protein [Xylaria sp. FL0064]